MSTLSKVAAFALLLLLASNPAAADGITNGGPSLPLSSAQGGTGDTGTAWTAYTPTVSCGTSGTITTNAVSGRWKAIGKSVFIEIHDTITTLGSCLGNLQIGLPVTAQGAATPMPATDLSVGGGGFVGGLINSATLILFFASAPSAHDYYAGGVYESQ